MIPTGYDAQTASTTCDSVVGLSVITTRDVLKRWNESGPDGLTDGRKSNGSASKLTDDQRTQLLAALKERPPDGGLWSGPKVVRYVRTTWAIEICPQTGWKWLVDLGFTLQVPRPSHPKAADPAARKRWKKTRAANVSGRQVVVGIGFVSSPEDVP